LRLPNSSLQHFTIDGTLRLLDLKIKILSLPLELFPKEALATKLHLKRESDLVDLDVLLKPNSLLLSHLKSGTTLNFNYLENETKAIKLKNKQAKK